MIQTWCVIVLSGYLAVKTLGSLGLCEKGDYYYTRSQIYDKR
jgi:hypothetical protein